MIDAAEQPVPADAEVAQRAARSAVDEAAPAALDDMTGELQQPDIRQRAAEQQTTEALRVPNATGFDVPAVGFKVAIHWLDPETLRVDAYGGAVDGLIAEQIPGLVFPTSPVSEKVHRTGLLARNMHVRQDAALPGAQAELLGLEGFTLLGIEPEIVGAALHIVPSQLVLDEVLKRHILEFASPTNQMWGFSGAQRLTKRKAASR